LKARHHKELHCKEIQRRLAVEMSRALYGIYGALAGGAILTSGGIQSLFSKDTILNAVGVVGIFFGLAFFAAFFWLTRNFKNRGLSSQSPTFIEGTSFTVVCLSAFVLPILVWVALLIPSTYLITIKHNRRIQQNARFYFFYVARDYLGELRTLKTPNFPSNSNSPRNT